MKKILWDIAYIIAAIQLNTPVNLNTRRHSRAGSRAGDEGRTSRLDNRSSRDTTERPATPSPRSDSTIARANKPTQSTPSPRSGGTRKHRRGSRGSRFSSRGVQLRTTDTIPRSSTGTMSIFRPDEKLVSSPPNMITLQRPPKHLQRPPRHMSKPSGPLKKRVVVKMKPVGVEMKPIVSSEIKSQSRGESIRFPTISPALSFSGIDAEHQEGFNHDVNANK
mmetsp:Transcript_28896/g.70432  ORF Transcript_28896/g.70432 Transcript_28896/m.70432 type:complete len:221 (-) Transcript_28896:382-1044(-)